MTRLQQSAPNKNINLEKFAAKNFVGLSRLAQVFWYKMVQLTRNPDA